ncbi:MAG: DNA-3-methyladenine glycosylase 2 family protein, partial [Bacteroidota bacterium]
MEYIKHLSKDKVMAAVLKKQEPLKLVKRKNFFHHLCASIISQQLSVRVAEVIHGRYLDIFDGKEPLPEIVLQTPVEKLRSIGFSNAKASYVHNIARFALEHGLDGKKLHKLENEELMEYLTQIKGVGRWTVEMQMMFTLGREDIFAIDDLGIQNAMIALYKLKT